MKMAIFQDLFIVFTHEEIKSVFLPLSHFLYQQKISVHKALLSRF